MRSPLLVLFVFGAALAVTSCASNPGVGPKGLPLSPPMRSYFQRYPIGTTDFRPSALGPSFDSHSHEVRMRFDYPDPPRKLFDHWMALPPTVLWDGPSAYFSTLLVPTPQGYRVYDRSSASFPRLRRGMLVFLRLKIDVSLEIPVAFEVTRVDYKKLVFQLTYLKQNVTHGVQTLIFRPHNGGTTVMHDSRFFSGNALRDALYPIFHRRLVNDFYRAMETR